MKGLLTRHASHVLLCRDNMQSYIGVEDNFLLENGYLVARLEEIVLSAADSARFSLEDINEIFRIMHTIKSSAGIMMYDKISILAHKLEDVFHYLREYYPDSIVHDELAAGILQTADFITAELYKIRSGEPVDGDGGEIVTYLEQILTKVMDADKALPENIYQIKEQYYIAPKAGETKKYYQVKVFYRVGTKMSNVCGYSLIFALNDITDDVVHRPADLHNDESAGEIMQNGLWVRFSTLASKDEIGELIESSSGEKEFTIEDSSIEEYFKGFINVGVPDLIINLDDDWDEADGSPAVAGAYVIQKEAGKVKSMTGKPAKAAPTQEIFQIPLVKINELSELVDKIRGRSCDDGGVGCVNGSMSVCCINGSMGVGCIDSELTEMVNELWQLVSSIKKVQLKGLFQKMDRTVYDISRRLGKVVHFEAEGGEVEIDRNINELISESLIHIMRNAVDHGIEAKDERKEAGKKVKGSIVMTAGVNGGEIFISVSDDGRGLDAERIFMTASEHGLTDGRAFAEYSLKEIYQFILLPGFSTNLQVTEYSGRGVGLDIVEKNVASLGGRLEIDSRAGEWTEVSIFLPG